MIHLTSSQRYPWITVIWLMNVDLVLQSRNISWVKVLLNSRTRNSSNCRIWMIKRSIIQIIGIIMLAYRLQFESVGLLAVAKVGLLNDHRRSASEQLILHLHIAKVRLWVLVYLNSSFCPHLQVVIDLVLSQRLINLRSLFIYFAIVNIFMIHRRLHAKYRSIFQMLVLIFIDQLSLLIGSPTVLSHQFFTFLVLLGFLRRSPVLDLAQFWLLLKLLQLTQMLLLNENFVLRLPLFTVYFVLLQVNL